MMYMKELIISDREVLNLKIRERHETERVSVGDDASEARTHGETR